VLNLENITSSIHMVTTFEICNIWKNNSNQIWRYIYDLFPYKISHM